MDSESWIVWDAFGFPESYSGISTYALETSQALANLKLFPTFVLSQQSPLQGRVPASLIVRAPSFALRLKLMWPWLVYRHLVEKKPKSDFIFHGISNFNLSSLVANLPGCRPILTVHDVIPLLTKEGRKSLYGRQMHFMLPPALRLARRVVCVSSWTKNCLLELYPWLDEQKLQVIPNGCPKHKSLPRVLEHESARIKVLCVTRYEKYKKIDLLLKIATALPEVDLTLVTNKQGGRYVEKSKEKDVLGSRLKVFCHLTQEELFSLYTRTHVYLHPSEFEGFGLPALEALSFGCCVVFRLGSGGDDYLKTPLCFGVKGDNVDEWCNAVRKSYALSRQPETKANFPSSTPFLPTWEIAAGHLKKLYNECLSEK